jgi:hypothetical protein
MPRFVFTASIDPALLGVHHGRKHPDEEEDDEEATRVPMTESVSILHGDMPMRVARALDAILRK